SLSPVCLHCSSPCFFSCCVDCPYLHSFPTRRSSDLLDRAFLAGMGMESVHPGAKTIPEALFMLYQMTFAIITVALVAGSVADRIDRKSTRLNSSHVTISYAVFCLKKKTRV